MSPRNVVVVVLDTLRPDVLGSEGHPAGATPHLDALAATATSFTRAYAEFPLTVPFRTSLVTGTYTFPHRPWSGLRPGDRHLAELLSGRGWATAAFTDTPFRAEVGMHRGFDVFEELAGKLTPPPAGSPVTPGAPQPELGDPRDERRWAAFRDGWLGEWPRRQGAVGIGLLVDRAASWLDAHRRRHADRPYLLWVDSFQCHEPWWAPAPERDRFARPGTGRLLPLPAGPGSDGYSEADLDHVRGLYLGEVAHADHHVGRLLDAVDAAGDPADTLVLVCSDHGVPLGEHGRVRKYDVPLHDEMSRIVWTVRAPGLGPTGATSGALVQPPDLLATLVELLGLEVPASAPWGDGPGAPGGVEGRSLLGVLADPTAELRRNAFLGVFPHRHAVVTDRWKLIAYRGQRPDELFDLRADPRELVDLAATEPEVVAGLHGRLWRFLSRWARPLRG